jgi:hypothetical protein
MTMKWSKIAGLFALILSSVSCGSVIREGRSPVYMVIAELSATPGGGGTSGGTLLSDVVTKGSTFNDNGLVELRLSPKNIGTGETAPSLTANNEVTINRYRVVYRRADGRDTPGIDVPYSFDGAATGTIPAGGSLKLPFELVRHVAKLESPLLQLRSASGNMPPVVISTITDVTFYGRDQVGNELTVKGSILINFGDFADPS